jgi:hypothetical protein
MRVLFIADTLESGSGSATKVASMASEWERRGHAVWLASTRTPMPRRASDVAARLRRPPAHRDLPTRIRGELSFRLLYPQLFGRACEHLGIDLIYSRLVAPAPGLQALIRSIPFVLEINGDIAQEIPPSIKRVRRLRARALQLRNADGVVYVSRELSRQRAPKPRRSIVLANPCLPPQTPPQPSARPERPRLVMIGYTRHSWCGMDKVVELARALPEFDFVVIGAELDSGLPNLFSHGLLPQTEADRLIASCTVGLGPLALHRKGMAEASPLKARNCLALGLPLIQSYEDTDLGESDACILQIPNREDNVAQSIDRIREFTWRAFETPLSHRALELAQGRLSLQAKESERLAFMQECILAHGPR